MPRWFALVLTACLALPARAQLPERLADSTFWRLVNEMSEPGGFFRSDNFVSNELSLQHVIPALKRMHPPGGVYLGVGPEQNFTYIVALEPRMAFVVDIRRQNMLQHLMYKAMMEASETRAEFLSVMFSRPLPAGLDSATSAGALLAAFEAQPSDSLLLRATLAAIRRRLVDEHRFTLADSDLTAMAYVAAAFAAAGPQITYSFGSMQRTGRMGPRMMPSFSQLMVETDSSGVQWGFLANERAYRTLRDLHRRNLIVPLTGDFGGPKALRAVGDYVRARNAKISAFYTSNVEQYLFQQDGVWQAFYDNVATLPRDGSSTFIRAVFGGFARSMIITDARGVAMNVPGPTMRSVTQLAPLDSVLKAVRAGTILSYWDLTRSAMP